MDMKVVNMPPVAEDNLAYRTKTMKKATIKVRLIKIGRTALAINT
jgi:hypothetical protein